LTITTALYTTAWLVNEQVWDAVMSNSSRKG
jgi:hypothetical protein